MTAAVCGCLQDFIGADGSSGAPLGNFNQFQQAATIQGLALASAGVDPRAEQFGTLALATTRAAA